MQTLYPPHTLKDQFIRIVFVVVVSCGQKTEGLPAKHTFTGRPSLEMVMFLGILQVISLSRTLASQSTPATVMTMVIQELTRFSFWCCGQRCYINIRSFALL